MHLLEQIPLRKTEVSRYISKSSLETSKEVIESYDAQSDMAYLYDKFKEFETKTHNRMSIIEEEYNKKIEDLAYRVSKVEKKSAKASNTPRTDPQQIGDYQDVRNQLEYLKSLTEMLEDERKKDIAKSKEFTEDRTQDLWDQVQNQRDQDKTDTDKKLTQFKFEITEQVMENSDLQRKDLKDINYKIEKTAEDIGYIQKDLKTVKKRVQDASDTPVATLPLQRDENVMSNSTQEYVDRQFETKLKKLKNEITEQYEDYVNQTVSHNNREFVLPKIDDKIEHKMDLRAAKSLQPTPSIEDVQRNTLTDDEIETACERIINREVPQMCRKIVDDYADSA